MNVARCVYTAVVTLNTYRKRKTYIITIYIGYELGRKKTIHLIRDTITHRLDAHRVILFTKTHNINRIIFDYTVDCCCSAPADIIIP